MKTLSIDGMSRIRVSCSASHAALTWAVGLSSAGACMPNSVIQNGRP